MGEVTPCQVVGEGGREGGRGHKFGRGATLDYHRRSRVTVSVMECIKGGKMHRHMGGTSSLDSQGAGGTDQAG